MRFPAIDGLRGLAILAVIYQHAYASNLTGWLFRHGIRPFVLGDGWAGVSLFFILSGFVLSVPFIGKERSVLDLAGIRAFLKRRARRLLPLFVFISIIGFALFRPASDFSSLLLAVSTLHMFVPSQFYPLVYGPFWSLSIEIWASVALPFLILAAAKFGYIRVLLVIALTALAVRLVACLPYWNDNEALAIRDSVPGRLDDFAAGMVLAWLFARGHLNPARHWMPAAAIAFLAIGCLPIDLANYGPIDPPRFLRAFSNQAFTIGFSLLVAYSLSDANWIGRLLGFWPLQLLGLMCFSLYSWHVVLISATHGIDSVAGQIGFWFALLSISAFTYRYIEFPRKNSLEIFRLERRSTQEQPPTVHKSLVDANVLSPKIL